MVLDLGAVAPRTPLQRCLQAGEGLQRRRVCPARQAGSQEVERGAPGVGPQGPTPDKLGRVCVCVCVMVVMVVVVVVVCVVVALLMAVIVTVAVTVLMLSRTRW